MNRHRPHRPHRLRPLVRVSRELHTKDYCIVVDLGGYGYSRIVSRRTIWLRVLLFRMTGHVVIRVD